MLLWRSSCVLLGGAGEQPRAECVSATAASMTRGRRRVPLGAAVADVGWLLGGCWESGEAARRHHAHMHPYRHIDIPLAP